MLEKFGKCSKFPEFVRSFIFSNENFNELPTGGSGGPCSCGSEPLGPRPPGQTYEASLPGSKRKDSGYLQLRNAAAFFLMTASVTTIYDKTTKAFESV